MILFEHLSTGSKQSSHVLRSGDFLPTTLTMGKMLIQLVSLLSVLLPVDVHSPPFIRSATDSIICVLWLLLA